MSGWFVTTTSSKPAVRRRLQASSTPGRTSTSFMSPGGRGTPSRTTAAFSTPSRSRKTARRPMSDAAGPRFLEQSLHGVQQRLPRRAPVPPAKPTNTAGVETDHRHVAAPASLPARVLVPDLRRVEADGLDGEIGDLGDGDVVAGRDVERFVAACRGAAIGHQHGVDDVLDVDVGLALPPVAEDPQRGRIVEQPAYEVEADSVRLSRPHDVAEAEHPSREPEHEAIGGDQGLAGQL